MKFSLYFSTTDNYIHPSGKGVLRLPRGGNFISFLRCCKSKYSKKILYQAVLAIFIPQNEKKKPISTSHLFNKPPGSLFYLNS